MFHSKLIFLSINSNYYCSSNFMRLKTEKKNHQQGHSIHAFCQKHQTILLLTERHLVDQLVRVVGGEGRDPDTKMVMVLTSSGLQKVINTS